MEKKKEKEASGSEEKINGIPNMAPEEEISEKPPEEKSLDEEKPKRYSIISKDLCCAFAGIVPFMLLASSNENYKLTDSEKESLAPMWDDIFNKYLPGFMVAYQEEFMLSTAIGILLLSKSSFIKSLPKKNPVNVTVEKPGKDQDTEGDVTNF